MPRERLPYKVSVIMPTFNRAGFILDTIASVREQTYTHWELLIIDDGSDDETGALVAGIPDARIRYIRQEKSGIGGKLKNAGLLSATGDLIAFIDSDDLWEKTKMEKQVAALNQDPGAGFCLTGGYNFKTPGQPIEYFYRPRTGSKRGKVFNSYFESELPGFTQALMIRKECLAVTGLFREEGDFSDLRFILTLAWHFEAVILYEPLLFRRLHQDNYSNHYWEKCYREGIQLIRSYESDKMISEKTATDCLFRLYLNFGEDCLAHQERKKAFGQFLSAWKLRPLSMIPLRKTGKTIWRSVVPQQKQY